MTAKQFYGIAIFALLAAPNLVAQNDPASEPAVLAVAKVLPAVVSIATERVVRRSVRDPFEDFMNQYFGNYRSRPREVRQTLQSLGSGFLVDPAGYIDERARGPARRRFENRSDDERRESLSRALHHRR